MNQPNRDKRTQTRQRQGSITSAVLPRSTPLPNFFLDHVMPLISATAWKVLCFVWRKTVGWNKRKDHISLSQISKGAGIGRDSAIEALVHGGGTKRFDSQGRAQWHPRHDRL